MKVHEIFKDIADLRSYCDGLEADTTYQQLLPSLQSTANALARTLTSKVVDAIVEADTTPAYEYLKSALATGALYKYQIFATIKKNNTDSSLYKYQHEEIKEHHISAHWVAMDQLLSYLDEHSDVGDYKDTSAFKGREHLLIKTAEDFDYFYGIDSSAYFFSKVQFLLRSANEETITLIAGVEPDDNLLYSVKRVICYKVIAAAVKLFDISELPRSIRYNFNHEYTKESQMQSREVLVTELNRKIDSWCQSISTHVKIMRGSSSIDNSSSNKESNKFYML